jgi:hypothetical protein
MLEMQQPVKCVLESISMGAGCVKHATRIARVASRMQPTVNLTAKKAQKEKTVQNVTTDISKKQMESVQNVQIPAQRAMVQPRQTVSHAHFPTPSLPMARVEHAIPHVTLAMVQPTRIAHLVQLTRSCSMTTPVEHAISTVRVVLVLLISVILVRLDQKEMIVQIVKIVT